MEFIGFSFFYYEVLSVSNAMRQKKNVPSKPLKSLSMGITKSLAHMISYEYECTNTLYRSEIKIC